MYFYLKTCFIPTLIDLLPLYWLIKSFHSTAYMYFYPQKMASEVPRPRLQDVYATTCQMYQFQISILCPSENGRDCYSLVGSRNLGDEAEMGACSCSINHTSALYPRRSACKHESSEMDIRIFCMGHFCWRKIITVTSHAK